MTDDNLSPEEIERDEQRRAEVAAYAPPLVWDPSNPRGHKSHHTMSNREWNAWMDAGAPSLEPPPQSTEAQKQRALEDWLQTRLREACSDGGYVGNTIIEVIVALREEWRTEIARAIDSVPKQTAVNDLPRDLEFGRPIENGAVDLPTWKDWPHGPAN